MIGDWTRRIAAGALVLALIPMAHAQAAVDARGVVEQTTERVLAAVRRDPAIATDTARLFRMVDELVLPHFDFERMARRVLGKHWRRASPEQRRRFVEEFQRLLVLTYSTALAEYSGETVAYLPVRERRDGEVSVRTEVRRASGPPIPITYEMYRADDGWKVYDVSIDGVSLVITYRSSFAAEIREKGIDGLIERLHRHNEERGARA